MKIKEIKRPSNIKDKSYRYMMSLLGVKGGLSFTLTGCKEEVYHMVGKAIGFDYDEDFMIDAMGANRVLEKIDTKRPGIIIYLEPKKKFSSARRINRIVTMLSKIHKLETPRVFLYKDSDAVLVRVDEWYYQSPVALSGLLTFIRAAARTDFVFNNIENFISKAGKYNSTGSVPGLEGDSYHIYRAKSNGNLKGFLNKTLKIFGHKDGDAWRIGKLRGDVPYDGILEYDSSELSYRDISGGIESWNEEEEYYDECQCEGCMDW